MEAWQWLPGLRGGVNWAGSLQVKGKDSWQRELSAWSSRRRCRLCLGKGDGSLVGVGRRMWKDGKKGEFKVTLGNFTWVHQVTKSGLGLFHSEELLEV